MKMEQDVYIHLETEILCNRDYIIYENNVAFNKSYSV